MFYEACYSIHDILNQCGLINSTVIFQGYVVRASQDVWAMGVMLFVVLTGMRPWKSPFMEDPDYVKFRRHEYEATPWIAVAPELASVCICLCILFEFTSTHAELFQFLETNVFVAHSLRCEISRMKEAIEGPLLDLKKDQQEPSLKSRQKQSDEESEISESGQSCQTSSSHRVAKTYPISAAAMPKDATLSNKSSVRVSSV